MPPLDFRQAREPKFPPATRLDGHRQVRKSDGAPSSPVHSRRLARSSALGVGRYLRDTASVDAGGGKDPACPRAVGQPLVAGSFLCDLSWADDFADPSWRRQFSDRLRLHQSRPDSADEQRRNAKPSFLVRGPLPISMQEVMSRLRGLGLETRIWTMPVEIPDAIPFEQDSTHASYDAEYAHRFWRILLQVDRVLTRIPRAVPRKSEPGAFLLGKLRYGGYPFLRTGRTPADGQFPEFRRLGDGGSLLA